MRLLLLSDSQYVCTKNKPCIPFVCVSQSVFEILEVRVEIRGAFCSVKKTLLKHKDLNKRQLVLCVEES